jgi:hypothetical protein
MVCFPFCHIRLVELSLTQSNTAVISFDTADSVHGIHFLSVHGAKRNEFVYQVIVLLVEVLKALVLNLLETVSKQISLPLTAESNFRKQL